MKQYKNYALEFLIHYEGKRGMHITCSTRKSFLRDLFLRQRFQKLPAFCDSATWYLPIHNFIHCIINVLLILWYFVYLLHVLRLVVLNVQMYQSHFFLILYNFVYAVLSSINWFPFDFAIHRSRRTSKSTTQVT